MRKTEDYKKQKEPKPHYQQTNGLHVCSNMKKAESFEINNILQK